MNLTMKDVYKPRRRDRAPGRKFDPMGSQNWQARPDRHMRETAAELMSTGNWPSYKDLLRAALDALWLKHYRQVKR